MDNPHNDLVPDTGDDPVPHMTAAAEAQESAAWTAAHVEHLQRRAIRLNREVQLRDAKIAELTARLETFEAEDPEEGTPHD